jgi:hypothetical protein
MPDLRDFPEVSSVEFWRIILTEDWGDSVAKNWNMPGIAAAVVCLGLSSGLPPTVGAADCSPCDLPGEIAPPKMEDRLPDVPGIMPISPERAGLIPAGPSYGLGQQDVDDLFNGDFTSRGGRLAGFDNDDAGLPAVASGPKE